VSRRNADFCCLFSANLKCTDQSVDMGKITHLVVDEPKRVAKGYTLFCCGCTLQVSRSFEWVRWASTESENNSSFFSCQIPERIALVPGIFAQSPSHASLMFRYNPDCSSNIGNDLLSAPTGSLSDSILTTSWQIPEGHLHPRRVGELPIPRIWHPTMGAVAHSLQAVAAQADRQALLQVGRSGLFFYGC
jgi:hypothetical protein